MPRLIIQRELVSDSVVVANISVLIRNSDLRYSSRKHLDILVWKFEILMQRLCIMQLLSMKK